MTGLTTQHAKSKHRERRHCSGPGGGIVGANPRAVLQLEKEQEEQSQRWFPTFRKRSISQSIQQRFIELAPQLKARTEQLLQLKQFWVHVMFHS